MSRRSLCTIFFNTNCILYYCVTKKLEVKFSRYRPGVAQRVGRGIALFFHDRGTRRGWVVSSTPRPHFTPGKDAGPILQEAGWAPGPVWTDGKSRPHRDSIPDRPVRSQSLYLQSYPAHSLAKTSSRLWGPLSSLFTVPREFTQCGKGGLAVNLSTLSSSAEVLFLILDRYNFTLYLPYAT